MHRSLEAIDDDLRALYEHRDHPYKLKEQIRSACKVARDKRVLALQAESDAQMLLQRERCLSQLIAGAEAERVEALASMEARRIAEEHTLRAEALAARRGIPLASALDIATAPPTKKPKHVPKVDLFTLRQLAEQGLVSFRIVYMVQGGMSLSEAQECAKLAAHQLTPLQRKQAGYSHD